MAEKKVTIEGPRRTFELKYTVEVAFDLEYPVLTYHLNVTVYRRGGSPCVF